MLITNSALLQERNFSELFITIYKRDPGVTVKGRRAPGLATSCNEQDCKTRSRDGIPLPHKDVVAMRSGHVQELQKLVE